MIETPAAQWQAWWRARAASDDLVLRAAAGQGFVLSIRQLSQLGISRDKIRTRVRKGTWTATGTRGVAAPLSITAGADPFLVRRRRHALECAAAALARPCHVVSGRSAAILHGLPTVHIPRRPELTGPVGGVLGRRTSAHVFGARLSDDEHTDWFGVAVTTAARSVVDVARHERRGGLVAADAALHDRLVDQDGLRLALERATGWPGIRRAREIVSLADARAESPLESVLRLAMHDDGFPQPQLQVEIAGYRVDMLLERQRLIIEADGRMKYSADELWREKRREMKLRSCQYGVDRVVWDDVMRHWPETARRLWAQIGT